MFQNRIPHLALVRRKILIPPLQIPPLMSKARAAPAMLRKWPKRGRRPESVPAVSGPNTHTRTPPEPGGLQNGLRTKIHRTLRHPRSQISVSSHAGFGLTLAAL